MALAFVVKFLSFFRMESRRETNIQFNPELIHKVERGSFNGSMNKQLQTSSTTHTKRTAIGGFHTSNFLQLTVLNTHLPGPVKKKK